MLAANYASTTSFLSTGALPDSEGEGETGKTKKVLKVKVGASDRIPKELKQLDTSKQVSKHIQKIPQKIRKQSPRTPPRKKTNPGASGKGWWGP